MHLLVELQIIFIIFNRNLSSTSMVKRRWIYFRCKSVIIIILKCIKIATLSVPILFYIKKLVLNSFGLFLHLKVNLYFKRAPQKFVFSRKSHTDIKYFKTIYVH